MNVAMKRNAISRKSTSFLGAVRALQHVTYEMVAVTCISRCSRCITPVHFGCHSISELSALSDARLNHQRQLDEWCRCRVVDAIVRTTKYDDITPTGFHPHLIWHPQFQRRSPNNLELLSPFHGAIAVPSVTRCRCRRRRGGHRCAGGVRQ